MEVFNLKYELNNEEEIKLFTPIFVENNKRKIKIIIDNKILPLEYKYKIKNKKIKYLKIKLLILIKDILDLSNMFNQISSLQSFSSMRQNNISSNLKSDSKKDDIIFSEENTNNNFENDKTKKSELGDYYSF